MIAADSCDPFQFYLFQMKVVTHVNFVVLCGQKEKNILIDYTTDQQIVINLYLI